MSFIYINNGFGWFLFQNCQQSNKKSKNVTLYVSYNADYRRDHTSSLVDRLSIHLVDCRLSINGSNRFIQRTATVVDNWMVMTGFLERSGFPTVCFYWFRLQMVAYLLWPRKMTSSNGQIASVWLLKLKITISSKMASSTL